MSKQMRTRKRLLVTIAVLSIFLASLCGVAQAKYIHTAQLQGSVTVKADLGKITVKEHEAVRQDDGSYKLNMSSLVSSNPYNLIPGLDVPKDPHVVIDKDNNMPVYVFIKVETDITAGSGITYQLADYWKPVEGTTNIYVYSEGNVAKPVTGDETIYILKTPDGSKHEIMVSQDLSISNNVSLNFYAAMSQITAGIDAGTVETLFTTP